MTYPDEWKCPICNTFTKNSELCKNCTFPKLWKCPNCNKEVHDSKICKECGYNAFNPKKSKIVIKKGDIIAILVVVYLIIFSAVLFRVLTQDKLTITGELLMGSRVNFNFWSFQNPKSVIFEITPFQSETNEYNAVFNGSNTWILKDYYLNKSGDYKIIVKKYYEDSVGNYSKALKVNSECTLDQHCLFKGEDYSCNAATGVCIQKEPGIMDFLDIILG